MSISEKEKENRRDAFDHAKISVRLEGFIIPKNVEMIHERYINGEITSEDRFTELDKLYKHDSPTNA